MYDPRRYQIATLTCLLVYGMTWLDFDITVPRVLLVLGTVVATQAAGDSLASRPSGQRRQVNVKSALIFNPTNAGLVAMLLVTDQVWVSPGQWGSVAFFAFLMACLGGLVVNRASRSDVTYAFVGFYCALLVGRSLYMGEPLTIPLHRLENGALLLFTFFMISDPKTTPDSRAGRVVFAALVALGAWHVQFRIFRTNGLLWSLAASSLAVPIIDSLLPGQRYAWPARLRVVQPVLAARSSSPRLGTSLRCRSANAGWLPEQ